MPRNNLLRIPDLKEGGVRQLTSLTNSLTSPG